MVRREAEGVTGDRLLSVGVGLRKGNGTPRGLRIFTTPPPRSSVGTPGYLAPDALRATSAHYRRGEAIVELERKAAAFAEKKADDVRVFNVQIILEGERENRSTS